MQEKGDMENLWHQIKDLRSDTRRIILQNEPRAIEKKDKEPEPQSDPMILSGWTHAARHYDQENQCGNNRYNGDDYERYDGNDL
jgi:hypothetical protein